MEYFRRKHLILSIIYFVIYIIQYGHSLQGIPSWMSLGMKSPFIEFKAEVEILSNISVSLNVSDGIAGGGAADVQKNIQKNGMPNLGPFIYSIDQQTPQNTNTNNNYNNNNNNNSNDKLKKLHKNQDHQRIQSTKRNKDAHRINDDEEYNLNLTENPITADMNSKKEVTLIELKEDDDYTNSDRNNERKYIIPLALKNPTMEPKKIPIFQQNSSTNIEDLKRHILMLQNLTQIDDKFQSKFVVFPNLQKSTTIAQQLIPTTTQVPPLTITTAALKSFLTRSRTIPTISPPQLQFLSSQQKQTQQQQQQRGQIFRQSMNPTRSTISLNLPKDSFAKDILRNSNEDYHNSEKITIIPQVFLQNDQMPMNDDSFESAQNFNKNDMRISSFSRKGGGGGGGGSASSTYSGRNFFTESTITSKQYQSSSQQQQQQPKKQLLNTFSTGTSSVPIPGASQRTNIQTRNKQQNNNRRQGRNRNNRKKKNQCKKMINGNGNKKRQNCMKTINTDKSNINTNNNNNNQSLSRNINNNTNANYEFIGNKKLLRLPRSQQHHHNNGGYQHHHRNGSTKSLLFPSANNLNAIINQTNNMYKETIDLNPNLCYTVDGLSYGQQKLCVLHTNIMPAVSRGARAAIQECRHQFKNRRWNCSTNEDSSVFGPITNIGSPEMAFVHALAAAGAASFIARACRDGQLASCGCSRSSRPKQLHEDWTWGGCGDDLEFGYKFSQNFIDIREKERKRGIRGLVTVPQKIPSKFNENLLTAGSDTNDTTSTTNITTTGNDTETEMGGNMDRNGNGIKQEDLLELLQEKITKEISNTKLQENEMHELQEKINREILNSKVFNLENQGFYGKKLHQRNGGGGGGSSLNRLKASGTAKARSMMNLHNNEAGRRAVIKKSKITCKCHGVSGSCSLITCWQQLTSMREIGDFLREKYDEATQVKLNKRGRLQVKDPRYKVPTALDLVYLDDSPDWCRNNRQLQWSGTHNRVCNKTSTGLDGCGILCCGRGYNTKKIVVKDRCNCKFHWCCQVRCETCTKHIEEYSCK